MAQEEAEHSSGSMFFVGEREEFFRSASEKCWLGNGDQVRDAAVRQIKLGRFLFTKGEVPYKPTSGPE